MNNRRQRIRFITRLSKRASVFLSMCVFAVVCMACGIPQWFFVYDTTDLDYIWRTSNSTFVTDFSGYAVNLSFTDTASSSLAKIGSSVSPSLMFFYVIDSQDTITTYRDNIISRFTSVYKLNGAGVPLSYAEDGSVLVYSTGSAANGDKVDYKLYPFSFEGQKVIAPGYMLNPSMSGQSKDSLSGVLKLQNFSTGDVQRVLNLYYGGEATVGPSTQLGRVGRYDNSNFYYAYSQLPPSAINADYNRINSDSENIYLHVFVAFNATPSSSLDRFNNIFWSRLKYVGWIKLNPQTT